MKAIKSIEITNFRSIKHIVVNDLSDLNIVVGRNDIGKSNFLKALNLFFNGETEIGKRYNFEEDFSRYAEKRDKQAQEITIKVMFNTHYKDNKQVTWTKVWRKEGFWGKKETIRNESGKEPSSRSGALWWIKNLQYKYIPAIKGSEYFSFLMGELHDVLSNVSSQKFKEASTVFTEGLGELMSQLTSDIDRMYEGEECRNEVSPPSNLRNLFSTLNFTLNQGGEKIPLDKRGDGIKARHIPVILNFIAQHLKSNPSRGKMPIDTIWGFEEPENNMELTTAFKAAEQFYGYSNNLQIFLNTHSPAFYQLGKKGGQVRLFFAKSHSAESPETILEKTNVSAIQTLDSHMGLLPIISDYVENALKKVNELQQSIDALQIDVQRSRKPLIVTEGKTDWKHFKKALQVLKNQGHYADIDVSFHEYDHDMGDTKLDSILTGSGKIPRENVVIGIFDCDTAKGKEIERQVPYKKYGNKVFGVVIPRPNFRDGHLGISVEHLYSDDDLRIQDVNGRRLYLSSEFNELGRLNADNTIGVKNFDKACLGHLDENNSKIVDCEVTNGAVNNIASSKSDFANNIAAGDAPYNTVSFDGFRGVFEKLNTILHPPEVVAALPQV